MQLALSTYQNRGNFYLSSKKSISYSCSSLELSNHLGNVLSVISDKVIPHPSGSTVAYYKADILQSQDYSPFGVTLKGRNLKKTGLADEFRFGYQGSEADEEIKGEGNSYTTFYRQLDPRLGRWFSIDPVFQPWQSPYCSMDNNPAFYNDQLGNTVTPNGSKEEKDKYVSTLNSVASKIKFVMKDDKLSFTFNEYKESVTDENGVTKEVTKSYEYKDLSSFEKQMVDNIESQYNTDVSLKSSKNHGFMSSTFVDVDIKEFSLIGGDDDQDKLKSALLETHSVAIGRRLAEEDLNNTTQEGYNSNDKRKVVNSLDPGITLQNQLQSKFGVVFSPESKGAQIWTEPFKSVSKKLADGRTAVSKAQNLAYYRFGDVGVPHLYNSNYVQIIALTKENKFNIVLDLYSNKEGKFVTNGTTNK
jgi:RHS repeat-associated protein